MSCCSNDQPVTTRLPSWFRQDIPDAAKMAAMKDLFRSARLHTVCESARCPNMGQCWGRGVATFMILGEVCTRACRFCAVRAGRPQEVDAGEPDHVAETIRQMRLRYVVITSVARDDLEDEGAGHFAATIRAVRRVNPGIRIEVLIPDFSNREDCLQCVVDVRPEVISHNIETVRRLSPSVRPQADYDRSLGVLRRIRRMSAGIFVKSSLMVGLGEKSDEVEETMRDLLNADCDILTVGQYLAPTRLKRHMPVTEFVSPETFDFYRRRGMEMGFKHVMSGPLVRSSYIAEEGYQECLQTAQQDNFCR